MAHTIPADLMALRIMLSKHSPATKQKKLAALAQMVTDAVHHTMECPDCGSRGPHESNGLSGVDFGLLCLNCNFQWEPNA